MTTPASSPPLESALPSPASMRRWGGLAVTLIMPVATAALMVFFTIRTDAFLTPTNLMLIAVQNSPLLIVSVAMAMLLMAGYVDLSVGSILALSGVVAAMFFVQGMTGAGIVVGLLVGTAVGVVNGVLIGYLGWPPLVVTLGMLAAGRGVAQTLLPGSTFGFPQFVKDLGAGRLLGVPYLVIIAIAAVLLGMLLMNRLPVGRHIIAIGVNSRAAFLTGIPVRRTVMLLYVLVGFATAIAGLLTVARLDSAPSGSLGSGFEVAVLTAVLLGSIPFTGGKGSIWRVVLGVWLLGVLQNGITLLNVGSEMSGIFTGLVLVLAAGIEALRLYWRRSS